MLICREGLACEYLVNSIAQIVAGDGDSVAGTTCIKLPAIDEAEVFIKEKNIWSAGGFVGMCYGLRFVI